MLKNSGKIKEFSCFCLSEPCTSTDEYTLVNEKLPITYKSAWCPGGISLEGRSSLITQCDPENLVIWPHLL